MPKVWLEKAPNWRQWNFEIKKMIVFLSHHNVILRIITTDEKLIYIYISFKCIKSSVPCKELQPIHLVFEYTQNMSLPASTESFYEITNWTPCTILPLVFESNTQWLFLAHKQKHVLHTEQWKERSSTFISIEISTKSVWTNSSASAMMGQQPSAHQSWLW